MKVIIVSGGVMGLATAWALAHAGQGRAPRTGTAPQSARLLDGDHRLIRRLSPSRQIVAYFDLPDDRRAVWATGPMVIDKTGDVGLYLVPPAEGRGLKIGDHAFSRSGDPAGSRDASAPRSGRCSSATALCSRASSTGASTV